MADNKTTADLLKEIREGKPFPVCAYGAHSWVRGEHLERGNDDLYLKTCVNGCEGQYFCSWQEWQLLPKGA